MPDENFKISIDTGASATKVTYEKAAGGLECFTMAPYCAKVSAQTISSKANLYDKGELPPLESSWVQSSGNSYLLGVGAQKYFGSEILDKERKFEKSLYKILAILAYVSYVEDIFEPIDLGVLLPFDEYGTKIQLEKSLRSIISESFKYCDRPQSLKLGTIKIRPEGSGTYLQGLKPELDKSKPIGSLVIGQRNASFLYAVKGKPQDDFCQTCDLGYRWLVKEVCKLTGYKGELEVTQKLVSGNMPDDMKQAYYQVLPEYWELIQSWLMLQVPVTHVVASGGGAIALKPYIRKLYGTKVSWADGLAKEIEERGIKDKSLVRRVTDCYGVLRSLQAKKAVAVA